ncbi:hypothetical protein B0H10DRAFT_2363280 [Mycena sp. CBHHK59/15]|nr:hypothetical protein B0H10DRAFT_2363280 [Mycena sp. CBHHK59/15]
MECPHLFDVRHIEWICGTYPFWPSAALDAHHNSTCHAGKKSSLLLVLPPHPACPATRPTRSRGVEMASDVGQSKHISANQELIDSLSGHDLMQFRHYIHSPAYIRAHAEVFLDNVWINISELRDFLLERNTGDFPDVRLSASATPLIIKVEPTINSDPIPIRTRILREDNHDILKILSDSEPENGGVDSDEEVSEALIWAASRSSSILPPNISTTIDLCSDDDEPDLEESDTVWQDEGISSHVLIGDYRVTAKVKVGRLEYVSGLPSIYPIDAHACALRPYCTPRHYPATGPT